MAHVWRFDKTAGWRPHPLADGVTALGPAILRRADAEPDGWVLLVAPGAPVTVNGRPVLAGVAVLRHLDEIQLPGSAPIYFLAESRAAVESFAAPVAAPCARCQQPIEPGQPNVQCPRCGLRHHQTEGLPCWTYADHCAGCDHATALGVGFAWTPEAL